MTSTSDASIPPSAIGGVVGAMVQAQGAQEAADDQAATQEAQAQAERRKGQAEAASKLRITRSTLYRRMERYGLKPRRVVGRQ